MTSTLAVIALAEGTAPAPAEQTTAVQIWTLAVAAVAAVAAIVAAILNAIATSRRERSAWLRELQIDANREFYATVQAVVMYVITGPPAVAINTRRSIIWVKL